MILCGSNTGNVERRGKEIPRPDEEKHSGGRDADGNRCKSLGYSSTNSIVLVSKVVLFRAASLRRRRDWLNPYVLPACIIPLCFVA